MADALLAAFPEAYVLEVLRPAADAYKSMATYAEKNRLRFDVGEVFNRCLEAQSAFDRHPVKATNRYLAVKYQDLESEEVCKEIHSHLTGLRMDAQRWNLFKTMNIQPDARKEMTLWQSAQLSAA